VLLNRCQGDQVKEDEIGLGGKRNAHMVLVDQPEGDHMKDQVIDRKMILKWIRKK
jgi:hypothetical protein